MEKDVFSVEDVRRSARTAGGFVLELEVFVPIGQDDYSSGRILEIVKGMEGAEKGWQ